MKIQDVGKQHPPFDVPAGQAAYMISSGDFVAYVDPKSSVRPVGKFEYGILPDTSFAPPAITFSCPVCTLKGSVESNCGTAHKYRHFHCGHEDFADEVTAAEYVRLFKDWKRRQQNSQEESKPTPKRVYFATQGAR